MKKQDIYDFKMREIRETVMEQLGLLRPFLEDDNLTDIMVNQDGSVFVDGYVDGMKEVDLNISVPERETISKVLASWNQKILSEEEPFLSGRLPTKERFEIVTGEVTGYEPTITIRKPPKRIFLLDDYVREKTLSIFQKRYLQEAILKNKKNILFAGPTGSGKTSFMSACINELAGTKDRIATLEEVLELMIPKESIRNLIRYTTTEKVASLRILRSLMRHYIDRLFFGEIRYGKEAEALVDGWNTGHSGGMTSIHANSASDALDRIKELLMEENPLPRPFLVSRAIHVVVALDKSRDSITGKTKRFVREIIEVNGYDRNNESFIWKEIA